MPIAGAQASKVRGMVKMPIEIRELVIRVAVEKDRAETRQQESRPLATLKQEILAACTEKIEEMVQRTWER